SIENPALCRRGTLPGEEQPEIGGEADLSDQVRGEIAATDPDRRVGRAADGSGLLRGRADLHFRIAKRPSLFESHPEPRVCGRQGSSVLSHIEIDSVLMAARKPSQSRREAMGGLAKGIAVIRAFTREHPAPTLSDIARSAAIPAATARRCLLTLEDLGYITRHGRSF